MTSTLQTIADALHALYDDAYSPVRAIATAPVELNKFTRPHWQPEVPTHPHLRHARGAGRINTPTGDRDVVGIYEYADRTITNAYAGIVPTAARQRRRGGAADGPTRPDDLISMLATIHQVLTRTERNTDTAKQLRQLARLADQLKPWTEPPQMLDSPDEQCWNPRNRHRCKGLPIIANDLCNSCYQHEKRLQERLADRYRLPPRPGDINPGEAWRAPNSGQTNDRPVTSNRKPMPTGELRPPMATATTRCAGCHIGITVPVDRYTPGSTLCDGCRNAA